MENIDIQLKPSAIYAFSKVFHLTLAASALVWLAWWMAPIFILFALAVILIAVYRYAFIRHTRYRISVQDIRITKGLLMKRTDQVELFRVKDYVIIQPLLLRIFKQMTITLKSTDAENPVICFCGIPQSDLIDIIRERVLEARRENRIFEIN